MYLQLRHFEQHRKQIAGVAEIVVGIDVRKSPGMPIRERRQRRHLPDQPARLQSARFEVMNSVRVGIKGGERADRTEQHSHRMRVVAEPLHEHLDILVHHRVNLDVVLPALEVVPVRQLALHDQVRGLEVIAFLGEFFDRISAIAQYSLVAVDERDPAAAGRRVAERRIVGHQAEVVGAGLDLTQIHRANHFALLDRYLVFLAGPIVRNRQRVVCH